MDTYDFPSTSELLENQKFDFDELNEETTESLENEKNLNFIRECDDKTNEREYLNEDIEIVYNLTDYDGSKANLKILLYPTKNDLIYQNSQYPNVKFEICRTFRTIDTNNTNTDVSVCFYEQETKVFPKNFNIQEKLLIKNKLSIGPNKPTSESFLQDLDNNIFKFSLSNIQNAF